MASRDYARPQRPRNLPQRGKPARRKAPGKGVARSNAALGLPLWAWMVVSLSLLIFAAALYYVSRPVTPMDLVPSSADQADRGVKTIEIPPKQPSRFAFYEMLPSYEVVVPDEVINPPKPKPGSTRNNLPAQAAEAPPAAALAAGTSPPAALPEPPAEKPTTAEDVKPASRPPAADAVVVAPKPSAAAIAARDTPPQPTAQLAQGEKFLIQVAAFRARADAEQRVAALTLAGLSARVEQVTIDNRDTWYRVRLGPYGNAAAAAAAQQRLKAQGFSGVVMKVKN